ncbi:MAG: helix-turn-helix domain-containing protein [Gammaproteobacteria bacterium]|nr:helix-turn-helix domain-containing protein [Gammaproteobacteria bacterium]
MEDHANTTGELSPGQLLKLARERMSQPLSIDAVARRMNLSRQILLDIEADNYQRVSNASIYVRGYLRSYAKLLGLSEAKILTAFDALKLDIEPEDRTMLMVNTTRFIADAGSSNHRSSRRLLTWGSLVIALTAVIMVVLWWRSQQSPTSALKLGQKPVSLLTVKVNDSLESSKPMPAVVHLVQPKVSSTKSRHISLKKSVKTRSSFKPTYHFEKAH